MTMVRVHLPLDKKIFSMVYNPIDKYLSFFNIYQDWMMFSPNPARADIYMTAQVVFDDGSTDTYDFEKSSGLSLAQKYIYGERFRKIVSEAIRKDNHRFMWQDAAKFALRKVQINNMEKTPLRVQLKRHWDDIPEMTHEFRPHLSRSEEYKAFDFYTYEVL